MFQAEGREDPPQRRRASSQRSQVQAAHVLHAGGRRAGGGQAGPHPRRYRPRPLLWEARRVDAGADTSAVICVSVAELEEVLGLKPPDVPSVGKDRSKRTVSIRYAAFTLTFRCFGKNLCRVFAAEAERRASAAARRDRRSSSSQRSQTHPEGDKLRDHACLRLASDRLAWLASGRLINASNFLLNEEILG